MSCENCAYNDLRCRTMSPSDTWICRAVSPAHCAPDSCCRGSPRFYPDEQQVLLSPRVWRSPHKTASAEFEKGCVTGPLIVHIKCPLCFVPRPHPLTRRNGLVQFLGLAHTYVTVSLSNIQNILRQTCSKMVRILE